MRFKVIQRDMASQEKITILRRVWKEGKGKYVIRIPSDTVRLHHLEGKFVKVVMEVFEYESETT